MYKSIEMICKKSTLLFIVLLCAVSRLALAQYSIDEAASGDKVYPGEIIFRHSKDSALLKEGDNVPDFEMSDTTGRVKKLSSFRGKYIVLDVWASWCRPCINEYPWLSELREKMKEDNIVFLSISCDDQPWRWRGAISGFHMEKGLHWLIRDKSFMTAFGIDRIPRFILLDKEGKVHKLNMTRPSEEGTEPYLRSLNGIFPAGASAQERTFEIRGQIDHYTPASRIFLAYTVPGRMKIDTATIIEGKFTFKGPASGGKKAFMQMQHEETKPGMAPNLSDVVSVYLEAGTIHVTTPDSLKYARVSGTPLNEQEQGLRDRLAPYDKAQKVLESGYISPANPTAARKTDSLTMAYLEVIEKRNRIVDDFILAHKSSIVSLTVLRTDVDPNTDADRAIHLFDQLSDSLKETREGALYNSALTIARNTTIGKQAPDFSLPNPHGKQIALSSYMGKYILLDFWASWCAPCRAENPNLVKAYKQYKSKHFEVLGVSLDGGENAKEKWISAIEKDALPWEQVSDLGGWNSAVAGVYNIHSIPANILIDPTGKIIAKNLRGEALQKELSKLL